MIANVFQLRLFSKEWLHFLCLMRYLLLEKRIKKQSALTGYSNPIKTLRHGPSDRSRTCGLLNPIQARYQAALHPDTEELYDVYHIILFFENQDVLHCLHKFLLPCLQGGNRSAAIRRRNKSGGRRCCAETPAAERIFYSPFKKP